MKIQLALLLVVVFFVSLPSVVFAQLPETAQKSWEGPVFGLGLGLGVRAGLEEFESGDVILGTSPTALLPVQVRLGYGLSARVVLYGAVSSYRLFVSYSEWKPPYGEGGIMFRSNRTSRYYGFFAIGSTLVEDDWGNRYFRVRGGPGIEINPGLSVEGAGTLAHEGGVGTVILLDLTFNYHFY